MLNSGLAAEWNAGQTQAAKGMAEVPPDGAAGRFPFGSVYFALYATP